MHSATQLQQLATALAHGAVVLTPNYLSSDQLTAALYQQNAQAVQQRPAILPIDLWLNDLWLQLAQQSEHPQLSWHVLQPAEELLLWQQIIRQQSGELLLLNPEGSASAAAAAWQLLQQWQVPLSELQRQLRLEHSDDNSDYAVASRWLHAFAKHCQREQLLSLSGKLQTLVELLAAPTFPQGLLPPRMLLWGFDTPPPLYQQLFSQLRQRQVHVEDCTHANAKPTLAVQQFPQSADECHAAAQWARATLSANPNACIALISADSNVLKTTLARSVQQHFADSPGSVQLLSSKLADDAFVHCALTALNLVQADIDTLELCALLRSPFLLGSAGQDAAEQDARAELELKLRDRGTLRVSMVSVRELAARSEQRYSSQLLATALSSAQQLRLRQSGKQSLQAWLGLFEQLWDLLVPRTQTPALPTSLLKSWDALLKQAQLASHLLGKLSFSEASATLQQLARATSVTEARSAGAVWLLTPVMAAGLHFTHCWCLQMTESLWPLAETPHPYLPLSLQRQQQMPGIDSNLSLQQSRSLLASLQARTADEFHYSYAQFNADLPEQRSRLLPTLAAVIHVANAANNPALHPAFLALTQQRSALETLADAVQFPLAASPPFRGGSSVLEQQSACPFRAFANQRLRIRELPAPSYGIPTRVLGTCVHQVLQHFWQQLQTSAALHASSDEACLALLQPEITAALKRLSKDFSEQATPTWVQLESARLGQLLLRWLQQEKLRGAFSVFATEQEFCYRTEQLELRLRIDRIDQLSDDSFALIDYKTGSKKSVNWQEARPSKPQLLLYHAAISQQAPPLTAPTALLYANLHINDIHYQGISASEEVLPNMHYADSKQKVDAPNWSTLVEHWHHAIAALAEEFAQGYAAVQPMRPNSCNYCHLQSVCRIKELAALATDDTAGEEFSA